MTEPRHGTPEWVAKRREMEQRDDPPTAEELDFFNIWTSFWEFTRAIRWCLSEGSGWQWCLNGRCKYINIRVDMRSGNCRVTDQRGRRITVADLKRQPTFHEPVGES